MAYIKDLVVECANMVCKKRATKEVIDRWNGSAGKFCTSCAKTKLKELLRIERSPAR